MPTPAAPPQRLGPPRADARHINRQRVRLPWRLVTDPAYDDAALEVYTKVSALGQRPEGCTASVATLALYLGCSTGKVERGLHQLTTPHGRDQAVELTSRRRSLPGGRGTTAVRRTRPHSPDEPFVWVPAALAGAVTGRQLRAYAVIAHAHARRLPLSTTDLGRFLHHGDGTPVSTRTIRGDIHTLADAGWLTLGTRQGLQGRHDYRPNPTPQPASDPTSDPTDAVPAAEADGGSGAEAGEGSLAYKESPRTEKQPEERAAVVAPAVGEAPVGTRAHRAAFTGTDRPGRAALALRAGTEPRRHTRQAAYTGPGLLLSARVTAVLEPVRPLYQAINAYMQRQAAREISRQLDAGEATVERLRDRLERRYARTTPSELARPDGWLLCVALPRWGCGHTDCESGTMWTTGARCPACDDNARDLHRSTGGGPQRGSAARAGTRAPLPVAGHGQRWQCASCERPGRGPIPSSGRCADCRKESQPCGAVL